jgi:hypothetical protein
MLPLLREQQLNIGKNIRMSTNEYVDQCKLVNTSGFPLVFPSDAWSELQAHTKRDLARHHALVIRGGEHTILPNVDSFTCESLRSAFPFHTPRQANRTFDLRYILILSALTYSLNSSKRASF